MVKAAATPAGAAKDEVVKAAATPAGAAKDEVVKVAADDRVARGASDGELVRTHIPHP